MAAQKLAEAQKNLATHFEELQDINLKGQISGMRDAAAGMGSYSDVFQAWSDTHQKSVAVKRIRLFLVDETSNASDAKNLKALCREIRLWSQLDHPNVLRLLGFFLEGPKSIPNFVSEWMEKGTVTEYMKDRPMDAKELCQMLSGIVNGLNYLHVDRKMVHSDLKGSNILVSNDGRPLIADFGLSISAFSLSLNATTNHGKKGTLRWKAKELHWDSTTQVENPRHTAESDVWSFGMVIYELLTNSRPYHELTEIQIPGAISGGRFPKEPDFQLYPDDVQVVYCGLWSLARKCWNFDPAKRPSAKAILLDVEFILCGFNTIQSAPNFTTKAMIGDYLIKYSRRSFGLREGQRFFWIDPSSRALLWNRSKPTSTKFSMSKTKKVYVEAVEAVEGVNLSQQHRRSIIVTTADRKIKIAAPTKEAHETWLSALEHLPPLRASDVDLPILDTNGPQKEGPVNFPGLRRTPSSQLGEELSLRERNFRNQSTSSISRTGSPTSFGTSDDATLSDHTTTRSRSLGRGSSLRTRLRSLSAKVGR